MKTETGEYVYCAAVLCYYVHICCANRTQVNAFHASFQVLLENMLLRDCLLTSSDRTNC